MNLERRIHNVWNGVIILKYSRLLGNLVIYEAYYFISSFLVYGNISAFTGGVEERGNSKGERCDNKIRTIPTRHWSLSPEGMDQQNM